MLEEIESYCPRTHLMNKLQAFFPTVNISHPDSSSSLIDSLDVHSFLPSLWSKVCHDHQLMKPAKQYQVWKTSLIGSSLEFSSTWWSCNSQILFHKVIWWKDNLYKLNVIKKKKILNTRSKIGTGGAIAWNMRRVFIMNLGLFLID